MVFSSVPAYLDPSNWQQHQNHKIIVSNGTNPLLAPPHHPAPPPPPPPLPHGGGGAGSLRPGSLAERARLANIPMPEAALKCPRCESINTKFCYFNNYSLCQPRHFCKACRRYWTRGGSLRNVPVGGGCRRNKRIKSSSSKSPASRDRQTNPSSISTLSTNSGSASMLDLTPQLPPLRLTSPLGHLTDNFTSDMGLNYIGTRAPAVRTNEMNFHGGISLLSGGGVTSVLSSEGDSSEPWRLQQVQQFPFLGGLETSSSAGMYQFHCGESGFMGGDTSHHVRPKLSISMLRQLASVKIENNAEHQSMSRQLLSGVSGNDQWNKPTAWTGLSSFSSASTSNPL